MQGLHDRASELGVILLGRRSCIKGKAGRRAQVERNARELPLRRGDEARVGGKRAETYCGDWEGQKE